LFTLDRIAGTSTGGLIVTMLIRIRVTMKEGTEAYVKLTPKIFIKRRYRLGWTSGLQTQYDSEALEAGVKEMLRDRSLDEDTLFKDDSDVQCLT
jgi:patatin-like phospholipase/acyl hydrolase